MAVAAALFGGLRNHQNASARTIEYEYRVAEYEYRLRQSRSVCSVDVKLPTRTQAEPVLLLVLDIVVVAFVCLLDDGRRRGRLSTSTALLSTSTGCA